MTNSQSLISRVRAHMSRVSLQLLFERYRFLWCMFVNISSPACSCSSNMHTRAGLGGQHKGSVRSGRTMITVTRQPWAVSLKPGVRLRTELVIVALLHRQQRRVPFRMIPPWLIRDRFFIPHRAPRLQGSPLPPPRGV